LQNLYSTTFDNISGQIIEKAVSKSSAVAPSNPMVLPVPNSNPVVAGLVDLGTLIGRG